MSVTWSEDVDAEADENNGIGRQSFDDEGPFYDFSAHKCAGVYSWINWNRLDEPGRPYEDGEREEKAVPFVRQQSVLGEEIESPRSRLWALLGALESTIGELDSAPVPPAGDIESVAARLGEFAQRITALYGSLSSGSFDDLSDDSNEVIADWATMNRDQAGGLPAGLLAEDGSRLNSSHRITNFAVHALEDDTGEPLFE